MGSLTRFNLATARQLGIKTVIETGSWYGEGIQYAVAYGMKAHSCEINSKFFMIVSDRFKGNEGVQIYQLPSDKFCHIVEDVPAVYWLDAHLPELYNHHEERISYSKDLSVPLEKELEILKAKSQFKSSIVIIDDLRIYHPQFNYEGGNIDQIDGFDLIGWCTQNISTTHHIFVSESDQGYLIAIPKSKVKDEDKKEILQKLCYMVRFNCD